MNILFIHPNFPAQFRFLAEALAKNPSNTVLFATENPRPEWEIKGVKKIVFTSHEPEDSMGPLVVPFLKAEKKGEAVLKTLMELKETGFIPDIIYGHSGWGSTWFIRDIFPEALFVGYFEWYYNEKGEDVMFDRDAPISPMASARLRLKNAVIHNDLITCDIGISPTKWQKSQFPEDLQEKIVELHEGINTEYFKPNDSPSLRISDIDFSEKDRIITYSARGMEPYRGFPQFIESLSYIQKEDPDCKVIIVGSDRVCYGPPLPDGKSYKEKMLESVPLDHSRIFFTGSLPYGEYLKVLQASTVHVYLTRPFVLSWSLLEAMACGCTVVGSDTPPVQEVITEGVNGFLADFHKPENIAEKVLSVLSYPSFMTEIKQKARNTIVERYNLSEKLSKHLNIINNLTTPPI